jgi:anti-sigma B factor antagonist
MQISERHVEGACVVTLSGDGIGSEPSILKERIMSLLARGYPRIVLDVEPLRSMDSTCLAEIVATYKLAAGTGGVLKMSAVNPQIRRLLQVTKVDTFIQCYESEAAAIASFDVAGSRSA